MSGFQVRPQQVKPDHVAGIGLAWRCFFGAAGDAIDVRAATRWEDARPKQIALAAARDLTELANVSRP